jgi:bifunctional UDP-N-acetylglucosamine pyrophosphorylase / glucosamine-1-phosphate N-acetyltransferase
MPITDTSFMEQNEAKRRLELDKLMSSVKNKEAPADTKLAVAILAAGLGKRMKSPEKPKVMFEICSRPMIQYVVELALDVNADKIIPIVGYHREQVIDFLNNLYPDNHIEYAVQAEQHGTGHAIMQTESLLKDFEGDVLILSGDVPLLKLETVEKLIDEHYENNRCATLLTTVFKDSSGYGRIVRDENGNFLKIVEEKDASEEEKKIKEINPAIYIVNAKILFDSLKKITTENNQKEYYLTDIFHFIPKEKTGTVVTDDELEVTGVNSIEQLAEMEKALESQT